MATIVDIIKNVSVELDLNEVSNITTVTTATNNKVIQLLKFANRIGVKLSKEYDFTELRKEASITIVSGQANYALPGDLEHFAFDTTWNSSTNRQLLGPKTPSQWQYTKNALTTSGIEYKFTIKGSGTKQFYVDPTPTSSGAILKLEYYSTNFCKPKTWEASTAFSAGSYCFYEGNIYYTANGGTTGSTAPTHTSGSSSDGGITWAYFDEPYNQFLSDTDEVAIDQDILELGIMALYCQSKNLKGWDVRMSEFISRAGQASIRLANSKPLYFGRHNRFRFFSEDDIPDTISS